MSPFDANKANTFLDASTRKFDSEVAQEFLSRMDKPEDDYERKVGQVVKMIDGMDSKADQAWMLATVPLTNPFNLASWMSARGVPTDWHGNDSGSRAVVYDAVSRYASGLKMSDPRRWASLAGRITKIAMEFKGAIGKKIVSKFISHELMTLPTKQQVDMPYPDYVREKGMATIEAAILGKTIGLVHKYVPGAVHKIPVRTPALVSGYMGFTALKGGSRDDIIEAGVTVLGFQALNYFERAVKTPKLRRQYTKQAIEAARKHNPALYHLSEAEISKLIKQVGITPKEMQAEPRETIVQQTQRGRMFTLKDSLVKPQARVFPSKYKIPKFRHWANAYTAVRANDTGVSKDIQDPEIAAWREDTLKQMSNTRLRYLKKQRKLQKHDVEPNKFNPWISARHAFASLEEKTGIPVWQQYDRIMRKGGAANIKGFAEISSRIGIDQLSKLTPTDNQHIADYLFSPKTRVATANKIGSNALTVATKLESILQGPAAKQVQEMVARRWIKTGKAPADIWLKPTVDLTNMLGLKPELNKGAGKVIKTLIADAAKRKVPKPAKPSSIKKMVEITGKSEGWSASDKALIAKRISEPGVQNQIGRVKDYAQTVLADASQAKERGQLAQHVSSSRPWTDGLGVRRFYYMSDPAQQEIVDDYISHISLGALQKPLARQAVTPGTISYEAYARRSRKAIAKKGSVVNNILTHLQRISVANAVADDLDVLYNRLNKIGISEADGKHIGNIFDNLLMKRQSISAPWKAAIGVKRWFWRTRLSLASRPDATLWMSYRNALQNLGMAPTAINVREASKEAIKLGKKLARGKRLRNIDPDMWKRFQRDFSSYVSQRRAFYREFLLQDTANISREFGNKVLAQKAASLLERTGGMYGSVDEYVNRMPLWVIQYQTTKSAARDYLDGKIKFKKFLSRTGLNETRTPQRMMAQDLLNARRIDDLAAESANWLVEDVHLKYKTPERAGVEQTMPQRTIMGIYTFPRGATELLAYRGVIPMLKGVEARNWGQAKRGAVSVLKSMAAGELAGTLLVATVGKAAYDLWSRQRYEVLGPGAGAIAELLGEMSMTSYRVGQGEMTIAGGADHLAGVFARSLEEYIPLALAFDNVVESVYDTKSLNTWKLLKDSTAERLYHKIPDWPHVNRSGYQKVIHLLGGFEDPDRLRGFNKAPGRSIRGPTGPGK